MYLGETPCGIPVTTHNVYYVKSYAMLGCGFPMSPPYDFAKLKLISPIRF